jgi:hypothetical protein
MPLFATLVESSREYYLVTALLLFVLMVFEGRALLVEYLLSCCWFMVYAVRQLL